MQVIKDTLEPIIEQWDDPGDYPSGAGGGPLASYKYIAGCDGELTVEMTLADLLEAAENSDILDASDCDPKITVKQWVATKVEIVDGKVLLTVQVEECDGDVPSERDYDDRDD